MNPIARKEKEKTPIELTPPQAVEELSTALSPGGRIARELFSLALLAFAVWQLLTLGIPTLYALVDRRRRLAQAVTS